MNTYQTKMNNYLQFLCKMCLIANWYHCNFDSQWFNLHKYAWFNWSLNGTMVMELHVRLTSVHSVRSHSSTSYHENRSRNKANRHCVCFNGSHACLQLHFNFINFYYTNYCTESYIIMNNIHWIWTLIRSEMKIIWIQVTLICRNNISKPNHILPPHTN